MDYSTFAPLKPLISTPASATIPCLVTPMAKMRKSNNAFVREGVSRLVALVATSFFQALDLALNLMYAIGKLPLALLRQMGVKQLSSYQFSFSAIGQHIIKSGMSLVGTITGSVGAAIHPEYIQKVLCNIERESQWLYTDKKIELNKHFDCISYINLASAKTRRDQLNSYFKKTGIQADWYNAVDKNDVTRIIGLLQKYGVNVNTKAELNAFLNECVVGSSNQKRGRLACYLSHLTLLEKFRDENVEKGLVLEDDCRFIKGAQNEIEKAMQNLPEDWEIAYLGGLHKAVNCSDENILTPKDNGNPCWERSHSILCTHAYAVNQKGYNKLIAMMIYFLQNASSSKPLEPVDFYYRAITAPVNSSDDTIHARDYKKDKDPLVCYGLKHFVADQVPGPSEVEEFSRAGHLAVPISII